MAARARNELRGKLRRRFSPPTEGRMKASQESPEAVTAEGREFAKQLVLYADAITAFAVVQLLSFIYLLARGDCFTVNVLHNPRLPLWGSIIVSGAYGLLVILCHLGDRQIWKSSRDPKVAPLATTTWIARYAIIVLSLVATIGVLRRVADDMSNHIFLTECRDSKTEGLTHPCCAPCSTDHHN